MFVMQGTSPVATTLSPGDRIEYERQSHSVRFLRNKNNLLLYLPNWDAHPLDLTTLEDFERVSQLVAHATGLAVSSLDGTNPNLWTCSLRQSNISRYPMPLRTDDLLGYEPQSKKFEVRRGIEALYASELHCDLSNFAFISRMLCTGCGLDSGDLLPSEDYWQCRVVSRRVA